MDTNTNARNPFVSRVLRCAWTTFSFALGVSPMVMLLTHLPNMRDVSALLVLPGLLLGFLGAIAPGRLRLVPAFIGAICCLALGVTSTLSTQILGFVGLGVVGAVFSLALPAFREDGMPAAACIGCAILHACMPLGTAMMGVTRTPPLLPFATAYLIVFLFNTNANSLQSQCASHQQRPAQSMRIGNMLLTLILFLLVFGISQFSVLRDSFRQFVGYFILMVLYLLGQLMPGSSDDGGGGGGGADMDLSGLGTSETSAFWEYLEYVGIVIAIVAILAIVIWLGYRVYKLLVIVWGHIRAFMNRYAQSLKTDYIDQTEDLSGWGELGKSLRDQMGRAAARFKPVHWDSLDNRARIRAAYTAVLRREKKPDAARTARETLFSGANTGKSDAAALCESYERARYSDHEITDAEAANAKRAL